MELAYFSDCRNLLCVESTELIDALTVLSMPFSTVAHQRCSSLLVKILVDGARVIVWHIMHVLRHMSPHARVDRHTQMSLGRFLNGGAERKVLDGRCVENAGARRRLLSYVKTCVWAMP